MNKPLIASLAVAIAAFTTPALSAAAQTAPQSLAPQLSLPDALDLSMRSHDDWALPVQTAGGLDLSPRSHDDWAVDPTF